jgi:hypothetical protein
MKTEYEVRGRLGLRNRARSSELLIDQNDPFFFDHPLDHVSGTLLLASLLDEVRASEDPRRWGRVLFRLSFSRFCLLEPATTLLVRPVHPDSWELSASQVGQTVCEGQITMDVMDPMQPPTVPVPAVPLSNAPIDAAIVHRHRPENVMIGVPQADGDGLWAKVLDPPFGHRLNPVTSGHRSVERLIEAARQLGSSVLLTDGPRSSATQLVLNNMTVELPSTLDPDAPLALFCPSLPRGRRMSFDFKVVDMRSGLEIGWLQMCGLKISGAAFQRQLNAVAAR